VPDLPPQVASVGRALARVRVRALGSARRASVHVLMRAGDVPVVRPFARIGMRVLFDSMAGDWERIRRDPTYREGFEDALRRLPSGFRPSRALDAACGTGLVSRWLVERWPGSAVVGFDLSPRMVERARELVPDARFEVASVHELPYADGEFDLVTMLDGVVDVDELLRVLHREGRLLVVYSRHGTTPVSRPLDELSAEFERRGAACTAHVDGPAHVLVVRHRR
jgi:ubiquinone/menaquinone biosynthesis C-methylase UbiE